MNLIPGEKLNIHFINEGLDHILCIPCGTTIDECLKMFLRTKLYISDIEGCSYNLDRKFLYNGKFLKFGDETPVEQYFKFGATPKINCFADTSYFTDYQFNQEEMRQILMETERLYSKINYFRNMEQKIFIEKKKLLSILDHETELPLKLILKDTEVKDIIVKFKRKNKENILITMSNS